MSMKLAPKLTAVIAEEADVAVAVAVAAAAAVVVTAVVAAVGTNNPVLSKKLDARRFSFNNSGLEESRHRRRMTTPFCLAKISKGSSFQYTFK